MIHTPTFKNIRVPITKATGKTRTITKGKNKGKEKQIRAKTGKYRTQRVQIMKNGRYKFVKNKKGKTGKKLRVTKGSKTKSTSSSTKNVNSGGNKTPVHLAATIGIIAYPAALALMVLTKRIDVITALGLLAAGYTGYNPVTGQANPAAAITNYSSIGAGTFVTWLATKLKINKYFPPHVNL